MSNGKYSNEASYPQTRIQSDSSHTDAPAPITALNQTSLVDETPDSNLMGLVTEQMQEDMVHKSSEHPNPPHLPPLALIQATNAEEPSTQPISSSRPSLTNVDAITPIPGVSNVSLPGRYVQFAPQQSISTPSLLKTQAFREDKEAPTITKPKGVAGSISSTSQLTRINSSSTTLPTRKSAGPRPFAGHSNAPLPQAAHALPATALATHLTTNLDDGLSRTTATQRLAQYGANELGDGARVRVWQVVGRQVANAMTLVLTLAMAVSFGIGSYIEGGVVALVIALNVVVGSWQEYAAEKTMGGLRQLASPTANVVREGVNWTVPTREVVVGDMVELTVGDTVPADLRLVEAVNFETDESLLTGESLPVRKDAELVLDEDTGPGDRLNVAFSTSTVTKGRARGIVFATGMFTGIGSIAQSLRDSNSKVRQVRRKADGTVKPHWYVKAWAGTGWDALRRFLGVSVGTPLQQKLSVLALLLFGVAIVCAIIVLGANGWANNREVIIYAVATGLSMIPASLVVVLIITMANGTHAMSKRNVIVRNAKSLESLGSVTDICSDKTGTITQGKMVVARAWIPSPMGGTFIVEKSEDPFNPRKGAIIRSSQRPIEVGEEKCEAIDPLTYVNDQTVQLREFLNTASLANLANVHRGKSEDEWMARGDPTEIAIQVFASRFDWNRARWTGGEKLCWKQVTEFPFDSNVKRMSVIFEHLESHERWVFTKGAVERIIDRCVWIHEESEDKACNMTEHHRQDILEQMNALASMGLRTLAFASRRLMDEAKEYREEDRDEIETDLVFRGIVGIYDPPRPESAGSVKMCHEAGIVVHMVSA
jgi:potassium/sodium efflux P-type ATPase